MRQSLGVFLCLKPNRKAPIISHLPLRPLRVFAKVGDAVPCCHGFLDTVIMPVITSSLSLWAVCSSWSDELNDMRENTRIAAAWLELWQSSHDHDNLCSAHFLSTALLLNNHWLTNSNCRAVQKCCVMIYQLEHKHLRKVPLVKDRWIQTRVLYSLMRQRCRVYIIVVCFCACLFSPCPLCISEKDVVKYDHMVTVSTSCVYTPMSKLCELQLHVFRQGDRDGWL